MLAIEVNFLTGRYVATAHNDRERSEWPPEPARLFSAMVAAWAEAGEDAAERAALEWLEALPPPALTASAAVPRRVVSHFVPVNDTRIVSGSYYDRRAERIDDFEDRFEDELVNSGGELTRKAEGFRAKMAKEADVADQVGKVGTTSVKSALELLPEGRTKQERQFPSMTPEVPRVSFVWRDADGSDEATGVLDGLLARVTRLGHSSSLVSCRLVDAAPEPSHLPDAGVDMIRCTAAGQLRALEQRFAGHQAVKPRALPFAAVRYGPAASSHGVEGSAMPDTAGDWMVFQFMVGSRRIPTHRTVDVAMAMRKAIMSWAEDPIPEGLSGHRPDGSPTPDPHVAFVPLPFVGYEHADGRIMGVAISLPAALDDEARTAVLRAVGRWERDCELAGTKLKLVFGRGGELELERRVGPIDLMTLRPDPWRGPSTQWATATPIALPTHPGRLSKGTATSRAKAWARAEAAVARACEHVGLPQPSHIALSIGPYLRGARPTAQYGPFRQRGRDGNLMDRRLLHAALTFDAPVQGPLMLGAGRFLGLGLMRPAEPLDCRDSSAGAGDENGHD